MIVGKMSKKGQIVIPKEIRDRFNLKPGDAVIFRFQGNRVILEKIQEKMTDILKTGKPVAPSAEYVKKLREEWTWKSAWTRVSSSRFWIRNKMRHFAKPSWTRLTRIACEELFFGRLISHFTLVPIYESRILIADDLADDFRKNYRI